MKSCESYNAKIGDVLILDGGRINEPLDAVNMLSQVGEDEVI